MAKPQAVIDWATLPAHQRATPDLLRDLIQRTRAPYLRKYVRALERGGCHAAVLWRVAGRFMRCTNRVAAGERYCGKHGGMRRSTRLSGPSAFGLSPLPPRGGSPAPPWWRADGVVLTLEGGHVD